MQTPHKQINMEEFNTIYKNFRDIYEECSTLIANGIELETSEEQEINSVSKEN